MFVHGVSTGPTVDDLEPVAHAELLGPGLEPRDRRGVFGPGAVAADQNETATVQLTPVNGGLDDLYVQSVTATQSKPRCTKAPIK